MKLRSKILAMSSVLAAALIASAALGAAFASAAGDQAAGKQLFTSTGCGGCHTLADAGASGKSASNLDTLKPSFEVTLNSLINSPSGMPSNNLSAQQREDLATYVVAVAGMQAPGSDTGGNTGSDFTGGGKSSTVSVKLKGWKIKISPKKVSAGVVTFRVSNRSRGLHQFAIQRVSKKSKSKKSSTRAKSRTRAQWSAARANRLKRWRSWLKRCKSRKRGLKGNMCKIKPGHTRKIKRRLASGTYRAINAVPGSYTKGRGVKFTVTEATAAAQTATPAVPATEPGLPPLSPDAQAYVDAGCAGCHSLDDARATSTVATPLDVAKPSYDTVKEVVTDGMLFKFQSGSVADLEEMPAYSASLSPQQIHDMANYVSTVTGGGDGSSQPAGRQDFLLTGCASCHTFADVGGTASDPGGSESYSNLDVAKANKATVVSFLEKGAHHMPVYKEAPGTKNPRQLNPTELDDVATYVSNETGGSAEPDGPRQTYLVKGCNSCHTLADAGGVGERASSLDVGKPHYDTTMRILEHNMGTSGSVSPKRWGLTPGMPSRKSYTAQEKTDIATYVASATGASELPTTGRQLSLVGGCGNCHEIADTDGLAQGTPVGENLDEKHPSTAWVDWVLTNGIGPQPPDDVTVGMPMYLSVPAWVGVDPVWGDVDSTDVDEKFSEAEIDLMSAYIDSVTG